MMEQKRYSMEEIIHRVLASDKFQEIVQNGEKGFFDKQEQIFIPKKVIPSLVKEFTVGHSMMVSTNKLDNYYLLSQVRINRALKSDAKYPVVRQYNQIFLHYLSTEFLKTLVNTELNFAVLYIDIVGSTLLSMRLPPEKLSSLVSIFVQEISSTIPANHGFVLKYVGDSVIAFFPESENFSLMCSHALDCAMSMRDMLKYGINEALTAASFEPINIRIGIEAGVNQIIQLGGNADIVGHVMNMAAKITSMAKPNSICIGKRVHSSLNEKIKNNFAPLVLDHSSWKYQDADGKVYSVYEYVENSSAQFLEQEMIKIDT